MFKLILALFLTSISLSSFATHVEGKVQRIYPSGGGSIVNFRLHGDACKTPSPNTYWRFNADSEQGKMWFSMLLSAAVSGHSVKVRGSECDPNKSEYISYLYIDY